MLSNVLSRGSEITRTNNSIVYRGILGGEEQHPVVEKELLPGVSTAEFRRELDALSTLEHPNLVKLAAADPQSRSLSTFWIEGMPVSRKIAFEGAFSIDDVLSIGGAMANGLAYLHEKRGTKPPIAHYDISDENILLGSMGPVLIDFGKAFPIDSIPQEYYATDVGSPYFMSPEKYKRQPQYGREADVFSFGIVLYRMVSGDYPFNPIFGSLKTQVLQDPPLPPSSRCPCLNALIEASMEKDPTNRPRADQLASALAAV